MKLFIKILTLFLLIINSFFFVYSSEYYEVWNVSYDGGFGSDFSESIDLDSSQNLVYVTGRIDNGSVNNFYTIKYNSSNGNQIWNKTYNSGYNDYAKSIKVDQSGNVYLGGYINNGSNIFSKIIKYDSNGNKLLDINSSLNFDNTIESIALDTSGNIYSTGYIDNGTNFNFYIVKYNSIGNPIWNVSQDYNDNDDYGRSIFVDSINNVYVTGYSNNGSISNFYTIKYNSSGDLQWSNFNGLNYNNLGFEIFVDSINNVYVTGRIDNGSGNNFYTVKYNSTGSQIWNKSYDSTLGDIARTLFVDNLFNVYVAGYSTLISNSDFFVIKYNSSGSYVSNITYIGNYSDVINGIFVDNSSNVYITGQSSNGSSNDYLTFKYSLKPNLSYINDTITNNSLDFNVVFNKEVNGTLEIFNSSYGLVSQNNFTNKSINLSIFAGNLSEGVQYFLNITALDINNYLYSNLFSYYTYVIDEFTALVDFFEKTGGSKVTTQKYFNVTITSNGTNNLNDSFPTGYSFMISRDIAYPQTNWNVTSNLSGWIYLGKNEFFEVHNNGEIFTSYNLSNGTTGNFSNFIFIDEKYSPSDDGLSLFVNLRICGEGENDCKYYADSDNNIIYEDVTAPEFVGNISIEQYYPSDNVLNFSFNVRDLESKVENVSFIPILNSSPGATPDTITNFTEDGIYNHSSSGYNFDEGKFYKIVMEAENKIGIKHQKTSDSYLIDTIAPINSTFDIEINNSYGYYLNDTINMTFDPGFDYNINYSILNLTESGLDYMKILVRNATLSSDVCGSFTNFTELSETFNASNTTHLLTVASGYCYEFRYDVYDRTGNLNSLIFNETVKVDRTVPQNNLVQGIPVLDYTISNPLNAENINKKYYDLTEGDILFYVDFNISDPQSRITHYQIQVIDNNTNTVWVNLTNFTQDTYEVRYNSSYITDGGNYKVKVKAFNRAELETPFYETNGATIFILKVPEMNLSSNYIIPGTGIERILDWTDDSSTQVKLFEENGFNSTCKYYLADIGYQNASGDLCGSSGSDVNCDFNSSVGVVNSFYVSCFSNDSIKSSLTYNTNLDNLDLEVYVEENQLPQVTLIGGVNILNSSLNILENETLNLLITLNDSNNYEYVFYNYSLSVGNLTFNMTNIETNGDQIRILFYNTSGSQSLNINGDDYEFYFNGQINHSDIINLNDNSNSNLTITSTNLSEVIDFSAIYNFSDASKVLLGGISNQVSIFNISSKYNLTFNNSYLIWDLSDFTNRSEVFNITFNITDSISSTLQDVIINITPSFYVPLINNTFYNLNNNFSLYNNVNYTINLTKYFYELNTAEGLNESLSYEVNNDFNVTVSDLDTDTGILILRGDTNYVGNGSIDIRAKSKGSSYSNYTTLYFNITTFVDNVSPILIVSSPINNSVNISNKRQLFVNVSSNETLSYIDLDVNGFTYRLCSSCMNYQSLTVIPNLGEFNNTLTFEISDYFNNLNTSTIIVNFSMDFDLDTIPDYLDNDSDGDSINDSEVEDKILGSYNYTDSNFNNISIYVNNSINFSINYTEIQFINFTDSGYTYFDFNYNFSENKLDLRNLYVEYDNSSINSTYLFVKNLNLTSTTKNIYVDKINDTRFTSICIKDTEVNDVSEISSTCNSTNEIILNCEIGVNGNYTCANVTQNSKEFWKISGLSNSVVKLICTEDWSYGSWSACSGGTQTRSYNDLNSCGTQNFLGSITQSCTVPSGGGGGSGGAGGGSSRSSPTNEIINIFNSQGLNGVNVTVQQGDGINLTFIFGSFLIEINEVTDAIVNISFDDQSYVFSNFIRLDLNNDFKDDVYIENVRSLNGDVTLYAKYLEEKEDEVIVREVPVFIGNFNDEFSTRIEFNKLYSFNLGDFFLEGKFVQGFGSFSFKSSNYNFDLTSEVLEIDINQDGKSDFNLYIDEDSGSYFLKGFPIEIEVVEPPVIEPEQPEVIEGKSYLMYYVLVGILILVIILIVVVLVYNKHKREVEEKKSREEAAKVKVQEAVPKKKTSQEILSEKIYDTGMSFDQWLKTADYSIQVRDDIDDIIRRAEDEKSKDGINYESVLDSILEYSQVLKDIILKESKVITSFRKDIYKYIEKGYSRVRIYFYLKNLEVSESYIEKILNFDFLITNYENFVKTEKVNYNNKDELKRHLVSKQWFAQSYVFDGNTEQLLEDILSTVEMAFKKGFVRENFKTLFMDNFVSKIKEDRNKYFDFTGLNLKDENFDRIKKLEEVLDDFEHDIKEFIESLNMLTNVSEEDIEKLKDLSNELYQKAVALRIDGFLKGVYFYKEEKIKIKYL